MSLEAALDEEMRDVVALLEGRKASAHQRPASKARAASPGVAASPVRSMLDVGNDIGAGRHASIAGTTSAGVSSPMATTFGSPPVRSMLDAMSPPPAPGSLASRTHRPSHGSASPPPPGRNGLVSPKMKPEDNYNFEMLPSIESQAMPLRVTQGGKKKKPMPSAMASIFGAVDAGRRGDGRHGSVSMLGKTPKSVSPAPRALSGRSQSPATRKPGLNTNSLNLHPNPGTYVSDTGQIIDLASAYRRLSDAALLKSGGTLSSLPKGKGVNAAKGEQLAPDGGVRLTKDYDAEDAVESSDEDSGSSDEEWNIERRRGRGRTRKGSGGAYDDEDRPSAKSLLGAAEEERKEIIVLMFQRN
jgi:hypothetical protein